MVWHPWHLLHLSGPDLHFTSHPRSIFTKSCENLLHIHSCIIYCPVMIFPGKYLKLSATVSSLNGLSLAEGGPEIPHPYWWQSWKRFLHIMTNKNLNCTGLPVLRLPTNSRNRGIGHIGSSDMAGTIASLMLVSFQYQMESGNIRVYESRKLYL